MHKIRCITFLNNYFFRRLLKTFSERNMKNDLMRLKTHNSIFKNVNTLKTLNLSKEIRIYSF